MELGGVYINSFFVLKWDKHWPQWKILQLEATCERNKRSWDLKEQTWRCHQRIFQNNYAEPLRKWNMAMENTQCCSMILPFKPQKIEEMNWDEPRWTDDLFKRLLVKAALLWLSKSTALSGEIELSKNGGPQVVVVMSKFIRRSNPIS